MQMGLLGSGRCGFLSLHSCRGKRSIDLAIQALAVAPLVEGSPGAML
jgi:hypothetical protein